MVTRAFTDDCVRFPVSGTVFFINNLRSFSVDDIDAALSSGDLFFFPSKEENEAIVLLEAAAHGLPIVTRNLPAYKDLLIDGQSCLKGETTEEFVELVQRAMEENEVRGKLTENAKESAEEYSLRNIGKKYLNIYEEFPD